MIDKNNDGEFESAATKGDVDCNGKIDAADATMVLQYYAYLSTDGTDSLKEFIMNIC